MLSPDGTTASGGAGNGATGLHSQGGIILNSDHHWLFAFNAGSNSVSSFEVDEEGELTLMHTIGSGGTTPVSLTCHGDWVYVVNAGSGNICGFSVDADGMMTMIPGSSQMLSAADAMPAQISFKNDGSGLYVTEKMTNMISVLLSMPMVSPELQCHILHQV